MRGEKRKMRGDKMKVFKKINVVALAGIIAAATVSLPGCKQKADSDQTLEVFVTNAGYGTQWLVDMLSAFKEESWVKEKYPELEIPGLEDGLTEYMDSLTIPADKITSGGGANTADLLVSCQPVTTQYNSKDSSGNRYFEELSSVYESEVPGENGVKVKDKMDQVVYDALKVETSDGTSGYYTVPWVRGTTGFFYNKTRLNAIYPEATLPNTTDEFTTYI